MQSPPPPPTLGAQTQVTTTDGRVFGGFDCVLSAIGRIPKTDTLGLENTKVERTAGGLIKVDEYENTTSPGVCVTEPFTHHVSLQGVC